MSRRRPVHDRARRRDLQIDRRTTGWLSDTQCTRIGGHEAAQAVPAAGRIPEAHADGLTPSKAMPFSDFMRRDVEAGKIEEVTIAGQKVSGIYGAAKEP
jgi:hypothetical protein